MKFIKRLYWRVHQHMFSRDFFPAGYLFIYKDVANANINPWEHYVKHGRRENRQRGNTPPSYFDKNVYLNLNPDVRASGIDAWHHYVLYGHAENRAYTSKERPKVIQCEIKKPVKDETRSTSGTDEVDFSIIMPTYNRAYIIQNSIDSVLSQTYRNFELIIADDGSTDETESLIHTRYKAELDQGIIRYIKCPHRGVCATRNAALREVRKSWIAYVDSDNTIREHFLRTFADAIMEHPNTRSFYAKALITQTKVELGRDFDYSPLRHANYIDLGMFVHHVSLYRQHGGFDETLKRLVDWDLILKYTYEEPPYYIKKVVLDYNDDKWQVDRITMKNSLSDSLARVRQKARVKAVTTLIMVSYNEKLVRHAIESALMQEGNIEHHIIVIDNASSNDVREMCEHYAKTYPQIITLVRHKKSISRTSIILNCIGLIKSDFVALMTADECWTDQHRLHKMTSFLDANTDCPLCFNSFLVLDDEKSVIRKVAEHDCLPYKLDVRDVKNLIDNSRTYWCDTVVIWKDVLEQMLLEASNNELEISTLLHHALKYGKIGYLRERMGVRRMVSSHSLKEGLRLRKNRHTHELDAKFDERYYLEKYPDVRRSRWNAYAHYIFVGRNEGRFASEEEEINIGEAQKIHQQERERALFDAEGYLRTYADVKRAGMDPWVHYCNHGRKEGRLICNFPECSVSYPDFSICETLFSNDLIEKSGRRVLLVHPHISATFDFKTAQDFQKMGYGVDIWTFSLEQAITTLPVSECRIYVVPEKFSNAKYLYSLLSRYEFVFADGIRSVYYATFCNEQKVPHMWVIREALDLMAYKEQNNPNLRAIKADSKNIYCISEYTANCFRSAFGATPEGVWYNSFETPPMPKTQETDKLVFSIVVGPTPASGVAMCLSAFVKLSQNLQEKWQLIICGTFDEKDKEYCATLKDMVSGYSNIVWINSDSEKKTSVVINNSDFLLHLSQSAPWSPLVVEAAMRSVPSIISTTSGAEYIVRNGAGYIVDTDTDSELLCCLNQIIRDGKTGAKKMGAFAYMNYHATSVPGVKIKRLREIMDDKHINGYHTHRTDYRELLNQPEIPCAFRFGHVCIPERTKQPIITDEVAVIIPIYNGLKYLKELVASLFSNTDVPCRYYFIDDCSTEDTVQFLQRVIEGRSDCVLVRNEKNLGFLHTVRRGVNLAGTRNFVILNTDTVVPPKWLSRLMAPIYMDKRIASVTPYSSCATLYSFPHLSNEKANRKFLEEEGVDAIDAAFSLLPYEEILTPTGHGFCMAISRCAWNEIGPFNIGLYGRGYGDEVDWSQRALAAGWKHVMASNLYVAHHHTVSFTNEERIKACERSNKIIAKLYPDFLPNFHEFNRISPHKGRFAWVLLILAANSDKVPSIVQCRSEDAFVSEIAREHNGTRFVFLRYDGGYTRLFLTFRGMSFIYENFDETVISDWNRFHLSKTMV